jgi:hypothetical protein
VFNNIDYVVELDLLCEGYQELDGKKTMGIDGVTNRRALAPSATVIFILLNKQLLWRFKADTLSRAMVHFGSQFVQLQLGDLFDG